MKNLEIDSYKYSKLIFKERGKIIQWSKDSFLNKWCWDNGISACKNPGLRPYILHKNIIYKNVNCKTIKLLKENIGENLADLGW